MKTINQYITEHMFSGKKVTATSQGKINFKYTPKTTNELIKVIKTELDNGNTDLNCIDTSKITDMSVLFSQYGGIKLTNEQQKTLDISKWDVSNVKTMYYMFNACEFFNSDLSKWNVSNVENMQWMFHNCDNFYSDLSKWNVSKLKYAASMFFGCATFNSNLSNWDVSNVEDMKEMFFCCESFNSDISKWNVSKVTDMKDMFKYSGLEGNEPSWYKK